MTVPILAFLLAACCAAGPKTGRPLTPAAPRPAPAEAPAPSPPTPGQVTDINPLQAWNVLQGDPAAVLLDVRTQAEYVFVGHPIGALNLPLEFWEQAGNEWRDNPDFNARVTSRLSPGTTVITMCRSGNRGKTAAQRLVSLGFTRVYNMTESFEGAADPLSKLRIMNGWRNRNLPWTYDVDPKLYYRP
jgi:rhodanese-related sulfurtransferase